MREERGTMSKPTTTVADPMAATTLVKIDNLVMHFPITQGIVFQRRIGAVHAVDGVSLSIPRRDAWSGRREWIGKIHDWALYRPPLQADWRPYVSGRPGPGFAGGR